MLSVARCGYDNAYGARLRGAYPPEVPAVLKANEALRSAAGGVRVGGAVLGARRAVRPRRDPRQAVF